jgi:hypothetical protein
MLAADEMSTQLSFRKVHLFFVADGLADAQTSINANLLVIG